MPNANDRRKTSRNVKARTYGAVRSQQPDRRLSSPARLPKPRRNTKRQPASPLMPMLIRPLLFLGMVALVALAIWSLRLPRFEARQVSVYGAQTVSAAQIASLVPLPAHENVLLYWLRQHKAAAQAVESAEPAVETAHVGIRPPGTVTVTVVERQPYALLRQGNQYWVVDRSGVPFRTVVDPIDGLACLTLPAAVPSPVLGKPLSLSPSAPIGAGFSLLAALASDKMATLMKIREITVDQNANLCLNMTNNLQIRLGQADQLPQKLALATAALTQDFSLAQRAAYLDFTDPDRPAWKPRSAAVASSPPGQDLAD